MMAMEPPPGFASTAGRVASTKAYAVFDGTSGDIVHVHRVITMEGAEDTNESAGDRALALAREHFSGDLPQGQHRINTDALRVVEVDPDDLLQGARLRINVETGAVVRHVSRVTEA